MEKKPATAPTAATSDSKTEKKIERVLIYHVTHGSNSRLKAEKAPVFDHALPSTMSNEIKKRLGLEFSSIQEKAIGYSGLPTIYHRYALTQESTETARQLINKYRIKRGADPIQWEGAA